MKSLNAILLGILMMLLGGPTFAAQPDPFHLLAPTDGEITATALVLDWEDATDPNGHSITYYVEVSVNSDMSNPVVVEDVLDGHSSVLLDQNDGIQNGTTYYWRVTAIDFYGLSRVSEEKWQFTTEDQNPATVKFSGRVVREYTSPDAPVAQADVEIATKSRETEKDGFFQMVVSHQTNYTVIIKASCFDDLSMPVQVDDPGTKDLGTLFLRSAGNIDCQNGVTLADAILGLQVLAGVDPLPATPYVISDINNDMAVGLEEVLYDLQKLALPANR